MPCRSWKAKQHPPFLGWFIFFNKQLPSPWIKGGPLLVMNGVIIRYKWPCKWVTEVISPYLSLLVGDISPHFVTGSGVHLVATFNVVNCLWFLQPSQASEKFSEGHIPSELEELLTKPFSEEESPGWISAMCFLFLRGVAETLWRTDKVLSWRFWEFFDVYMNCIWGTMEADMGLS